MEKINIGLDQKNRKEVVDILQKLVADQFVLYMRTLGAHWNVRSHSFAEYHAFFKNLYEQQFDVIDLLAERMRALGAFAPVSAKAFLADASLKESTAQDVPASEFMAHILEDYESIIRSLRDAVDATGKKFKDEGTSNFLAELLVKAEKSTWMVRSFLID